MDTLTHALSGMLLARATAKEKNNNEQTNENNRLPLRTRLTAGFLAAAFPDADFLVYLLGPLSYLNHHRGLTHSVLM